MNDTSNPAEPLQTPKSKSLLRIADGDTAIIVAGIAIAVGAAFFPWYVFFHQESFGVKPMTYSSGKPLSGWAGTGLLETSPLAFGEEGSDMDAFDPLTTATIPMQDASEKQDLEDPLQQPFPAGRPFRLLHVANGRALIEDDAGMYMVQIGSVLPDNSRLANLERRVEDWVIVTSRGDVIAP